MTIILTSKTILLVLISLRVRSEVISGKFGVTKVTTSDYGRSLGSFYISSLSTCFAECQRNSECESVVFNKATMLCHTNGVAVIPSNLVTSTDPGAQQYHYVGKVSETVSTIRRSCTDNSHCIDGNSLCRDNICKCHYGYSHNSAINACVTSCASYGSTFQAELGRLINGYNEEVIYGVTVTQCEASCLQTTSFTCRTYEFEYSTSTCFLQTDTFLTAPHEANINNADYNLYTRDCA